MSIESTRENDYYSENKATRQVHTLNTNFSFRQQLFVFLNLGAPTAYNRWSRILRYFFEQFSTRGGTRHIGMVARLVMCVNMDYGRRLGNATFGISASTREIVAGWSSAHRYFDKDEMLVICTIRITVHAAHSDGRHFPLACAGHSYLGSIGGAFLRWRHPRSFGAFRCVGAQSRRACTAIISFFLCAA